MLVGSLCLDAYKSHVIYRDDSLLYAGVRSSGFNRSTSTTMAIRPHLSRPLSGLTLRLSGRGRVDQCETRWDKPNYRPFPFRGQLVAYGNGGICHMLILAFQYQRA